jgi:hypothetical protein
VPQTLRRRHANAAGGRRTAVDCATHGVLEPLILEGGFSERLRRLIAE